MQTVEESQLKVSNVIGYALLAVNIDSNKGSYLDYFSPMIIECLRLSDKELVSQTEIFTMLQDKFSITLPQHVIQSILKRLCRKKFVERDSILQVYKRNLNKIDNTNFKEKQNQVLENHTNLVSGLQEYLNIKFSQLYSKEEVEVIFEKFLNNSVNTLIEDIQLNEVDEKDNYMIASYLSYLETTHSPLFQYYESIFIGNMVSTAVYFTEPDKYQQKFKNTKVYFDTTFIIFALGYADNVRKEPCLELIKILREQHASLRCFNHNIDEIKDILYGCIDKVEKNSTDRFGTTEYFIKKNYKRSDIQTIIHGLEDDIKKNLRFVIEEKPPYEPLIHNISEQSLSEFLDSKINYKNKSSLQRDIDSLHAVVRLRQGQKSHVVEKCKALFVTTNNRLSYYTKQYFEQEDSRNFISPIISDYVLTTIQWIKNPNVHPNLPKKRIIADCIASVQPTERVIKGYLDKIKTLKESGQISNEKYYLLRTSEAREIIMDKTLGDEDVITNIDYQELAELAKQKIGEEKDNIIKQQEAIIEESNKALEQKEKEKKSILEQQSHKVKKQKLITRKISVIVHFTVTIILSGLFLWVQYTVLNKLDDRELSILQNGLVVASYYILPLLSFWGFGFWYAVKESHERLQLFLFNFLYN